MVTNSDVHFATDGGAWCGEEGARLTSADTHEITCPTCRGGIAVRRTLARAVQQPVDDLARTAAVALARIETAVANDPKLRVLLAFAGTVIAADRSRRVGGAPRR
jgi:hypothetical protein